MTKTSALKGVTFTLVEISKPYGFEFSTSAPVLHTHIKKTGGTTLWRVLSGALSASRVPHNRITGEAYGPQGLATQMDALPIEGLTLIGGHIPFGLHERYPSNPLYMTVLRQPDDLYTSLMRMRVGRGEIEANQTTLDSAIMASPDNLQTRMLSGIRDSETPCTEKHLERAKQNLETRYLFGVQNALPEFIKTAFSLFGLHDVLFSNYQTAKVSLPDLVIPKAKIEYDEALFSWVMETWREWNFIDNAIERLPSLQDRIKGPEKPPSSLFQVSSHFLSPTGPPKPTSTTFFEHKSAQAALLTKLENLGATILKA